MKKYIFLLITIIFCQYASAQEQDTSLLYKRFPTVPPFKITRVSDSTLFTKDDLKKKWNTIIIVFSPDCEHCQDETRRITSNIAQFKKTQIVMASPLDYSYLKKFYDEYHIADYPIITIGRDPSYFLGTFYKVRAFPSIFIYNKKGDLVESFSGTTPLENIINALKK